jgi:hypothetical protein
MHLFAFRCGSFILSGVQLVEAAKEEEKNCAMDAE